MLSDQVVFQPLDIPEYLAVVIFPIKLNILLFWIDGIANYLIVNLVFCCNGRRTGADGYLDH